MTAIELVNRWSRQGRISPHLYELLIRRLTIRPFSLYATDITSISAKRLIEMIESGEISRVRGIGNGRLIQLRQLARLHHEALYADVAQMARWSERNILADAVRM